MAKRTTLSVLLAVRDSRAVTGSARLVLDALVLRADWKNWTCYPSYATLAGDTGLYKDTVRRMVGELIEDGLITRKVRVNRSNLFTVLVGQIEELAKNNAFAPRLEADAEQDPEPTEAQYSTEGWQS